MDQISQNVIVETANLGSNNSIILTREGIVLIDSPHKPTDAVKWKREIDSRGKGLYLINTDHHIDHTLTNSMLPGTIISHEVTRRKLMDNYGGPEFVRRLLSTLDPQGMPLLPALSTRLPTLTLNDRLTLHLGDVTLEIVHRQGHTPNGLMVYLPEQKILFSGDIVCSGGLPAFQEALVFPWLRTLETVMDMDLQWVVPGHGDICTKEGVKRFRGQIEDLLRTVQKEMDRGISKDDIVDQIRFPDHVHVTTDSYQGYPQDMLEDFQRVSISNIYDQLAHRMG